MKCGECGLEFENLLEHILDNYSFAYYDFHHGSPDLEEMNGPQSEEGFKILLEKAAHEVLNLHNTRHPFPCDGISVQIFKLVSIHLPQLYKESFEELDIASQIIYDYLEEYSPRDIELNNRKYLDYIIKNIKQKELLQLYLEVEIYHRALHFEEWSDGDEFPLPNGFLELYKLYEGNFLSFVKNCNEVADGRIGDEHSYDYFERLVKYTEKLMFPTQKNIA